MTAPEPLDPAALDDMAMRDLRTRTDGQESLASRDRRLLLAEVNRLAAENVALREQMQRVEAVWNEGNRNDGVYEYVETADCDGNNPKVWRWLPALAGPRGNQEPASWEAYEAALYPEQLRADAIARGAQP